MSDKGSPGDKDVIETGGGSAGEAQELDPETAAMRADDLGLESQHALDERQERLRSTRRRGGPDLDAETEARDEADESVPDVEPTEPEEEPDQES
jgi:hypothetical protein